jgi:hypothetical protein
VIFENLGPSKHDEQKLQAFAPPSMSAIQQIFRRALATGSIFWGQNFKSKCKLRVGQPGFNSVDLVNVIRRCHIVKGPIYNGRFNGWEYELADLIEGYKFVLVVLLDGNADYLTYPQITVLSGSFRRGKINRRKRGIDHATAEQGGQDEA